jgi:membrane-associated phospholipid phosphatase
VIQRVIRWWPPIAVTAMVLLGFMVGKSSTPIDDWFLQFRGPAQWLLIFSDAPLLAFVMGGTVAVPLSRRRWRLAAVALLSPGIAWVFVQLLKPVFDRHTEGGVLAYPSGHTTVGFVIWGMFVVVAGATAWSVITAVISSLFALVGVGSTFHYFTDTIGGALLGSAIVCVAVLITTPKLTRVNPDAICVTQDG